MKWTEYVAIRRSRSTSCRAANVTFVAMRRVGVGPGVKMDIARSVKKVAMIASADVYVCFVWYGWQTVDADADVDLVASECPGGGSSEGWRGDADAV